MLLEVIATGSTGNAYVLTCGDNKLLLDCGVSWKRILKTLNHRQSDIAGCLVTHEHT